MKMPNAENRLHGAAEASRLMEETGLGSGELSRRLGLSIRTIQCYKTDGPTHVPMPYPVQYALEALIYGRTRAKAGRDKGAGIRRSAKGRSAA